MLCSAGLAACSARGDLGRAKTGYIAQNVVDPIDRAAIYGNLTQKSKLPQTDEERRLSDQLWHFFAAPTIDSGPLLGPSKVRISELKSGKAFEKTDRYYHYLISAKFSSANTRYAKISNDISDDLAMIDKIFPTVCAVRILDDRRRTAADSFSDLGADERQQLDLRLKENQNAVTVFELALAYRYQSYTYTLERLLIQTPNEAARDVDAKLSALAEKLEMTKQDGYCRASGIIR